MANNTNGTPTRSKWRGFAANALLFVTIVLAIRFWQQRDMPNGPAPALEGTTLAGAAYQLPSHPAQPVLVHFWATWCPVCRAEEDSIAAIAHDHPNVITVAMQSGRQDEVSRYLRERGLDLPAVNDADGSLSRAWGVHAVPASFIIAPDGRIRFTEVGYTTGVGLRLRLWLAKLLFLSQPLAFGKYGTDESLGKPGIEDEDDDEDE